MASTAPITGSTPGKIRTFLLDHERLIIVIVAAVVLWWGYGKYAQIRLDHDNAALKQAQIVAAQQAQQNAVLAAQAQQQAQIVAADKAQLQALTDKVTAQNAQLTAANVALANALTKQQKTDASLPVPALVDRWAQLAPGTNFSGAIGSGNNVTVTPSNALATVQQLEKVPVLTQELANETTLKANGDQLIASQNKSIFDLNGQVTTLNASVAGAVKLDQDHQAQCVDQIKVVKDEARKSKRRWFKFGFITGFVSGLYAGHALS
jgi:hypothetical protein